MIRDIVRQKMITAMKNKDKRTKDVYAYLLDQIQKEEKSRQSDKNPNPVLTDADEVAVCQKVVKAIKSGVDKTMSEAVKNGVKMYDLKNYIEDCEFKIKLYSEFLPEEMSEEQIKSVILETANELGENVNKGMLMKNLMPKVKGKADGKLVSTLVEKYLNGEL
jgi:uncharacterized protein YqeY